MTTEIHALVFDRTGGTAGQPDATGQARRVTTAELQAFMAQHLSWMAADSVLGRAGEDPTAFVVPAGHLFGSTPGGQLGSLNASQVDTILGLTPRFDAKANLQHQHTTHDVLVGGGPSTLQDLLAVLSRQGHKHGPSDVETTAPSGYVATSDGTKLVMQPPPSGSGSGNVNSPLTFDLDLAGFGLVSSGVDILRYTGGRIFLEGNKLPEFNEGTPAQYHAWIHTGSAWEHRRFTGADIESVAVQGIDGDTVAEQIQSIQDNLEQAATNGHTHDLASLEVPSGATPGQYITPAAGGGWEVINLPSAGGGITSPLSANLDIAANSIVSGAQQLLSWTGTQVLLGGEAVFPSTISSPVAGHVAVYDTGSSRFVNRLLAASESTVSAIAGGLANGNDVQEVLESLAASIASATLTDTDDLAEGATNLYATTSSVTAAGAVMTSAISDDETLAGVATDEVVSERAIKVYVDAAVAAGGGGGGLAKGTTFPGSPSAGDVFYRTDLRELFQYDSGIAAWIGATERTVDHYTDRLDAGFGQGSGGYIFGTGNAAGYRMPFDAVLTSASFQNVVVDTGQCIVRKAPEGGSVVTAIAVPLTAERGAVVDGQLVEIAAGELLSAHVSGFSTGVSFATLAVTYRRRIDV